MAHIMETLVGAELFRNSMGQLSVDGGEWQPVKPQSEFENMNLPPYRYTMKADAEAMLARLYPGLNPLCRRTREVK